jgi:hypothetical protein
VLDLAEKAGKTLQRDMDEYEELFNRIEEQRNVQEQLQSFMKDRTNISAEQDKALLEELE